MIVWLAALVGFGYAADGLCASGEESLDLGVGSHPVAPLGVEHAPVGEEEHQPLANLAIQPSAGASAVATPGSLMFTELPPEMLDHIIQFLGTKDKLTMRLVSKQLKKITDNNRQGFDIFIKTAEKFNALKRYTFSDFSEESKPRFPFQVRSINWIPVKTLLQDYALPVELWSLALQYAPLEGMKHLRVLVTKRKIDYLSEKGFLTILEKSSKSSTTIVFTTNKIQGPCILPLLRHWGELKETNITRSAYETHVSSGDYEGPDDTKDFFKDLDSFQGTLTRLQKLKVLCLEGASFIETDTKEKAEAFAAAIGSLKSLETLSLLGTNLGDEGLKALAPVLATLPNLEILQLPKAKMGADGAMVLNQHLASYGKLKHLYLDDLIGEEAACAIAGTTVGLKSFEHLDIFNCNGQLSRYSSVPVSPAKKEYFKELAKKKTQRHMFIC
ncbi:MAG: F-box protein [Alphaproteobacteria bacterium]